MKKIFLTFLLTAASVSLMAATATYDAALKTPKCGVAGASCDSGTTLVRGRANMSGGAEPSQPNTINSSCADGISGVFHSDESIDAVRVISVSSGNLTAGQQARVEADVWAYVGFSSDFLDIYYAADASAPVWTLAGTVSSTKAGLQTLSKTFALPSSGSLQAVRAQYRYGGLSGACTVGSYNDRDDLVFAVDGSTGVFLLPPTAPLTIAINVETITSLTISWAGATGTINGYRVDLSTSNTFGSYVSGWQNRDMSVATSTTVWNLTPATNYYVRVRAYNTAGASPNSFVQSGATPPSPVDMSLSGISNYRSAYKPNQTTNFVVQITNNGSTLFELATLGLYLDASTAPFAQSWTGGTLTTGQTYNWNPTVTTPLSPGAHSWTAKVDLLNTIPEYNETNNQLTVNFKVDDSSPIVTITAPPNGFLGTGFLYVQGSATDTISGVFLTRFKVDGATQNNAIGSTFSFGWNAGTAAPGTHVLSVEAEDQAGNIGVSSVSIFIPAVQAPGNVVFAAGGQGRGIITWDSVSPPASSYRLDVSTSPQFGSFLPGYADRDMGTFMIAYPDLQANTTYYARLRAVRGVDVSTHSATATYFSPDLPDIGISALALPDPYVLPGEQVTLTFKVKNFGPGHSVSGPGFEIKNNGNGLFTGGLPALAAGQEWNQAGMSFYAMGAGFQEGANVIDAALSFNSLPLGELNPGNNTASLTYYIDGSSPTVQWVTPADQAASSGTLSVQIAAADLGSGIAQILFFIDGIPFSSSTGTLLSYDWDTTAISTGTHTLTARVVDRAGFSKETSISVSVARAFPPAPPALVSLSPGSPPHEVMNLSWSGATGDIQGYRFDVSVSSSFDVPNYNHWDEDAGLVTQKDVYLLQPETTYYVRVRSYGPGGVSANSPTASLATTGIPDFSLSMVMTSTAVLRPGQNISVQVTAVNIGRGPTSVPDFFDIKEGTGTRAYGTVPLLNVGQSWQPSFNFSAAAGDGTHLLTGRVGYGYNTQLSLTNDISTLTYVVDGTPPFVAISTPTAGAVLSGAVPVIAAASDNMVVDRVAFAVDGVSLSTAAAVPYSATWNAVSGTHTLTATAYDAAGNSASASVLVTGVGADQAQRTSLSATALTPTLVARKPVSISMTMKNTGTSTWTGAAGYRLAAQNPVGNTVWTLGQSALGGAETIAPNASKAFGLGLIAPSTPGVYAVQWRMAKGSVAFGDDAINQLVTVVADTTPPTAPASLSFYGPSTTQIYIKWGPGVDNAAIGSYQLEISTMPDFTAMVPTYAPRVLSASMVSGLFGGFAPGMNLYARIRAVDVNGLVSGYSATAVGATLSVPDQTPPAAPAGLSFFYLYPTQMTLGWAPPADSDISGYRLDFSSVSNFGSFLYNNLSFGAVNSISIPGLAPGTTYYARLRAVDYANNISTNSGVAAQVTLLVPDTTPPSAPGAFGAVNVASTSLSLTWTAATDAGAGIWQYYVNISTQGNFATKIPGWNAKSVGNVTQVSVTGLTPGTSYWMQVRAIDNSVYSNPGPYAAMGPVSTLAAGGGMGAASVKLHGTDTSRSAPQEVFAYPSPARGDHVTLHAGVGNADRIVFRVYSLGGRQMFEHISEGPPAPGVRGPAYEARWDLSDAQTGVYLLTVEASRNGAVSRFTRRFAVIK